MTSVLFICLGNICRSPTAEAVMRKKAEALGLDICIESAGTGGWHKGEPPDPRARETAEARGYSFAGQTARQITAADFARFDYILAMDNNNLEEISAVCPMGYSGHIGLLLDFAQSPSEREVPDPYYGGPDGFKRVVHMIEEACDGLLAEIG